jgi:hypothetical protein
MGSFRFRDVGISLFAVLLVFVAEYAFASHFRYGYINWERDLTWVNPGNYSPGTIKVTVDIEAGLRWNFSDYPVIPVAGHVNPVRNSTNTCEAFGIVSDAFNVSCPPVGTMIRVNGGGTGVVGLERSNSSASLVVMDEYLNILPQGQIPPPLPAPGINPTQWPAQPTGVFLVAKVVQTIPSTNTMYARQRLHLYFDPNLTTVKVNWAGTARLSTLQQGNNDNSWRLQSLVDLRSTNSGVTKSPKSQSFPIVGVNEGIPNTVAIPSVAFDNLSNRVRLATQGESFLLAPTPTNLSLNQSAGTVSFTPPVISGGPELYAAQFIIESFDPANPAVVKATAPLDLMFTSAPGAAKTASLATGDGQTTYTANVTIPPTPFTFTVRSSLTPVDGAFIGTMSSTPLPAGATFTPPASCTGAATCVGTVTWNPTVANTSTVVCFGAQYNNSGLLAQAPQMCINMNLAPLATRLVVQQPPEAAAGGGPLVLKARLERVVDNAPLQGRTVTFTFDANPASPPWVGNATAVTDADGWATANLTTSGAVDPASGFTARFNAIAGELLASAQGSSVFSVKRATTSLNTAPLIITPPQPSVGFPLSLKTVLSRSWTDGGIFGVGAFLNFSLTAPSGVVSQVLAGPTDAQGSVTVNLPAPTATGDHTATAFFAGNDALFGNVTSPVATVNVRQRTQVTVSAGTGYQNTPTPVTALLVAIPSNTPLVGRSVTFTTSDAVVNSQTVTTDAAGVATANFTWAAPGAKLVTATFTPTTATELNRSGLEGNDSSSANTTIQPAVNTVTTLGAFSGISGQGAILTATLKTAANAPVSGATVTFSQVGGGSIGSGITLADGTVTVAFTPGAGLSGTYRADFAGMPGFAPSFATNTFVISKATTSLTAPLGSTAIAGAPLTVSATLTRTVAPLGAVANELVTFTISGLTATATTGADGVATATFPSLTIPSGPTSVTASFAGTATLVASTSSTPTTVHLKTTLTMNDVSTVAGASFSVSAVLSAGPMNTLQPNQLVSFVVSPSGQTFHDATDDNGVATVMLNLPSAGSFVVTAQFANQAPFINADGTSNPTVAAGNIVVELATSEIANVSAPATSDVGQPITVSTTLTRTSAPAGPASGGSVTFTVAGPNGTTSLPSTTNAAGVATTSFTPMERGAYSVTASYAGDAGLAPATTAGATTINVMHPTTLTMIPVTGAAGKPLAVTATLTAVPGDWGVGGQNVTFTFTGAGAPAALSGVTDGDGVASVLPEFATTGTFGVTASFSNAAAFFGSSSASSTVTATNTPPTIIDLPNITAAATSADGRHVDFTSAGNDAEDGALAPSCTYSSGTFPIGATTVTCTVTDIIGATASDSFTITITNAAPTIVDLPNITASATSADGRHVDFTSTGNDAEQGALTPVCTANPGTFQIGSTDVTCTVTDFAGLTASDTFTITITNAAPTILDLPNLSGEATGPGGAAFTFTSTGNDAEQGPLTPVCDAGSGTFEIGITTVNCSVTDFSGLTASDSFTITVSDTTAPALTLPVIAPASATTAAGRIVNYTATALDIVDGATAVSCSPASGFTFPIATTTVTCNTVDTRGNASSGTFDVTIFNNAPTFTAPASISLPATKPQGRDVTFTATGSDTEDGTLTADCQAQSGNTFPIGTTNISCTVTDIAGATASGSFSITITNAAPTILDLPNVVREATSSTGASYDFTSTGDDAEDGSLTPVCNASSGNFPIGVTEVSCTVTDVAGYTASDSFTVTVEDTTAPALTLPVIAPASASGPGGRIVTYTATALDIVDGATAVTCSPASGFEFPIATTTVTCNTADSRGNPSSGTFDVTITNNAPTFAAPASISLTATKPQGRDVTFTATGSDLEDGTLTADCQAQSGNTFPIGTTNISCTVTDVAGATASGSFSITITNTAPTILDLPNVVLEATGSGGAAYDFTSTGDDAEDGDLAPVCNASSGTFPIGTTNVSCTVTDVAGYTATDSFTVKVQDTTAPAVTVNSITVEQTSPAGATGNFTFSATDIVDGSLTPVCTPAAGTTFARGTTPVTCTVTDAHGNTGTATGNVTVQDTIDPVVTYTGNAGTYTVDQTINIICAASDAGSGVASTTCADVTGPAHTFLVGVNTRTATATDVAGRTGSASISFTVTVPPSAVGNVINTFFDSPTEAAKANQTLNLATGAPNASARAAHLNKLKNDINKEIGKTLTAAEAATLIALLNNLY